MSKLISLYRFAAGPILAGLAMAGLLSLLYPQYFKTTNDSAPSTSTQAWTYADAVAKAAPSVVNIYTLRSTPTANERYNPVTGRFDNGKQRRITPSTGSGVIVSPDGYIVTAAHVIEWAHKIRVALQDGREAIPQIVGVSEDDDVAVLKIDLQHLQAIEIASSDETRIGDIVLAIGNPFGVGQTVTQGIVSATRRKGLNIARFENFIQTDAAINPGNSGGALVDARGRLLGINISDLRHTTLGDASGIGFAIPVDRAVKTVTDLVEHGKVVRGWIGVGALNITPKIINDYGLQVENGVLITDTYQGGPADIAGLIPGDVVVSFNEHSIDSIADAIQEFADLRPGDTASLGIVRGKQTKLINVTLGRAPEKAE